LRAALRRREIYVSGAHRWRNPDEDLPADFEHNRGVHYAAIRKPRDGRVHRLISGLVEPAIVLNAAESAASVPSSWALDAVAVGHRRV
jgi:hypothetical protein